MKAPAIIAIAFAVVIVALLGVLIFVRAPQGPTVPAGADQTATTTPITGNVQTTFSPDGSIAISAPLEDSVITSPVTVAGEAQNNWYFEAVFPIKVLDSKGTVIGQGQANAQSDWTTPGTVPFAASITFTAPKTATGTIVFMNDNPSGDPAKQKQFSIEVKFK